MKTGNDETATNVCNILVISHSEHEHDHMHSISDSLKLYVSHQIEERL